MSIQFQAHEEFFTFHDPTQEGKLIDRKTEIRFDPLTNESSRIIFDPGAPFTPTDYTELAKATEGKKCPFCPENVQSFTPTFPDALIAGGRFTKGEAVAFPNLFPYSKHNAVTRMTDQHFVTLKEFTKEWIADAFSVAHTYLEEVRTSDPNTKYASINWNYLPPSGGSIIHPHIHVLASEQPTNYQAVMTRNSERFYQEHGENYFAKLKEEEKQLAKRWIGQVGSISWIHAFAPKNHFDFIGVLDAASSSDLTEATWNDLADSMLRYFQYFEQIGIGSFNMGLFIPVEESAHERVHIRLVPRMTVGALGTSDMNVFNYLHAEPLCLKVPEGVASEVAAYF